jgi:hypothetical protein
MTFLAIGSVVLIRLYDVLGSEFAYLALREIARGYILKRHR